MLATVDLPQPVLPTMATVSPGLIVKVTSFSKYLSVSSNLNDTFWNSINPSIGVSKYPSFLYSSSNNKISSILFAAIVDLPKSPMILPKLLIGYTNIDIYDKHTIISPVDIPFLAKKMQYPMVTGGTMIVSTLICFFGDKKPSEKEMISVGFAFVAMLLLFLIPV